MPGARTRYADFTSQFIGGEWRKGRSKGEPILDINPFDGAVLARITGASVDQYGLSSAVFTRDLERGKRFMLGVRAGMGHVNDVSVADSEYAPFGGEMNSGLGRFNSDWVIDELTRPHWITTRREPAVLPF